MNDNQLIWVIAVALSSVLALVIAYQVDIVTAFIFWFVISSILLLLRPE